MTRPQALACTHRGAVTCSGGLPNSGLALNRFRRRPVTGLLEPPSDSDLPLHVRAGSETFSGLGLDWSWDCGACWEPLASLLSSASLAVQSKRFHGHTTYETRTYVSIQGYGLGVACTDNSIRTSTHLTNIAAVNLISHRRSQLLRNCRLELNAKIRNALSRIQNPIQVRACVYVRA